MPPEPPHAAHALRAAAPLVQGKPPNCPQLLAAAETKMTAASTALKAANDNMNSTLPHLDAIVAAARQNQTTHDTAYNAALNTYNDAVAQHNKAQDQYNLDNASLVNIQKECAQPIKPPNCAQLIAKCVTTPPSLLLRCERLGGCRTDRPAATADSASACPSANKAIQQDSANLENTQEAIKVAQTSLAASKAALDEATADYWQAVKDKSDTVAALQATIAQAIKNQQQAVEDYEEVVAECK